MNKSYIIALIFIALTYLSCSNNKIEHSSTEAIEIPTRDTIASVKITNTDTAKTIKNFLPPGYIIFERIGGDLNKDGVADSMLIIKATDKKNIVKDEYRGELDRNRRGIIVLLSENNRYTLALKNLTCFSSENEDGGVYYAPELSIEVKNGNLVIQYHHGRYGYWKYTFRYQNSDFYLIGYDESNGGVVINSETSINFLTRQKIKKENTNENADGGDEVFKKTITRINSSKLLSLSEIKDFDELMF